MTELQEVSREIPNKFNCTADPSPRIGRTDQNYWWLRKVRKAFLEAADATPTFVELPAPVPAEPPASAEPKIVAILKRTNHLALEITDQASTTFLNALLGAMDHAQ